MAINSHGSTRWTTLLLVVNKILRLWDIFAEYFVTDGPLILRNFFHSDTAKTVVNFLSVILPPFNESINMLQVRNGMGNMKRYLFLKKQNAILPELIDEMSRFKRKIEERRSEGFYGMITNQLLRRLPPDEEDNLRDSFQVR